MHDLPDKAAVLAGRDPFHHVVITHSDAGLTCTVEVPSKQGADPIRSQHAIVPTPEVAAAVNAAFGKPLVAGP